MKIAIKNQNIIPKLQSFIQFSHFLGTGGKHFWFWLKLWKCISWKLRWLERCLFIWTLTLYPLIIIISYVDELHILKLPTCTCLKLYTVFNFFHTSILSIHSINIILTITIIVSKSTDMFHAIKLLFFRTFCKHQFQNWDHLSVVVKVYILLKSA